MHFLITAGPTREYLDPVRYVSNASSGKMGYACAASAVRRGHRVTLISGPTACPSPAGVKVIPVVTSQEMRRAVMQVYPKCDCVIMTAAVSDYRPKHRSKTKIKSKQQSRVVELVRTNDILAELGQTKKKQILIGFALEDNAPPETGAGKNDSETTGRRGAEPARCDRGRHHRRPNNAPWGQVATLRRHQ